MTETHLPKGSRADAGADGLTHIDGSRADRGGLNGIPADEGGTDRRSVSESGADRSRELDGGSTPSQNAPTVSNVELPSDTSTREQATEVAGPTAPSSPFAAIDSGHLAMPVDEPTAEPGPEALRGDPVASQSDRSQPLGATQGRSPFPHPPSKFPSFYQLMEIWLVESRQQSGLLRLKSRSSLPGNGSLWALYCLTLC